MTSSLAQQLARAASLNANLLNEKSRKQAASESYLFSPKEARQHDIDSLHALGLNGFLQLKSLQPDVARFEQALFSDTAKSLDRTLLPKEQSSQLDDTISAFLPLLGPFLLDAPSGKVLEWLVRRFRYVFLCLNRTPQFSVQTIVILTPLHQDLRVQCTFHSFPLPSIPRDTALYEDGLNPPHLVSRTRTIPTE